MRVIFRNKKNKREFSINYDEVGLLVDKGMYLSNKKYALFVKAYAGMPVVAESDNFEYLTDILRAIEEEEARGAKNCYIEVDEELENSNN